MYHTTFKNDLRHRSLGLHLIAVLLFLAWPALIYAEHGGTILWVEEVGAYEITVIGPPRPRSLRVGTNDITILLGRLSDEQIVLNAQVIVAAEPTDQAAELQTFPATHDNATNKLYYAAQVVFPTPGQWKLTIQVDGPAGSANTAFETEVMHRQLGDYVRYLVPASLVLVVFLFFVLNWRTRKGVKRN